jgi:hypothetical protein
LPEYERKILRRGNDDVAAYNEREKIQCKGSLEN